MPNSNGSPTQREIRQDGAIPYASQIIDDSVNGARRALSTVLDETATRAKERVRIVATGIDITTTDEVAVAIGGLSTQQFIPLTAIAVMTAVAGTAATGDTDIAIGTASTGTQILTATECTGLIGVNTKFAKDLTGTVKPALAGNATLYVHVTTADTTAAAGHLASVYIIGELI